MFSIHRKLFLALKKVQIVKITHFQVPFTQKKIPPVKFLILPTPLGRIYLPPPLTTIWKTLHQWNKFLPTPKSHTFEDTSGFFPKIRIFPGCITFFIIKEPKISMKCHKNSISCFLEKVVLINWLTGWQWCFHKIPFYLKASVQQYH